MSKEKQSRGGNENDASNFCSRLNFPGLLMRLAFGFMLFFLGVNKFIAGLDGFVASASTAFEPSWLPMSLVTAWLSAMPFIEVCLGLLLIVGLFMRHAVPLTGLFFVVLIAGGAISQNEGMVLPLFVYLIALMFLYKNSRSSLSIDKMLNCKTC